jgi:HEAT repeat protein
MDVGVVVLLAVVAIAVAGTIIAVFATRRRAGAGPQAADPTVRAFATLPEAERCDMIFAAEALEDEDSATLLRSALDDPSEAVALAAARALVGRGQAPAVDEYLERHPGDRSRRISQTLALISRR